MQPRRWRKQHTRGARQPRPLQRLLRSRRRQASRRPRPKRRRPRARRSRARRSRARRSRARRPRARAVAAVEEVAAVAVPEATKPFPPRRHPKRLLSPKETNQQTSLLATRPVARFHAGAAVGVGKKPPQLPTTRRTSL